MFKDKRLVFAVLTIAVLAISFWAGSRVPQLNEKALMGGDTQLESLGFDVVLPIQPDDPFMLKVLYTTVNWVKTNKKGMIFGVLFAAALMVLLGLLRKRSFENRFANSALGMTIGAPLGVCVNCAAPIAHGLHSGGARVETTISAMLSSPTLNVIVLTMLFALFPFYMVAIKLTLTIGFILICVPLLVKYFGRDVKIPDADKACPIPIGGYAGDADSGKGWFGSAIWMVKAYLKNLWYVGIRTVPLMFVAGFLGALLVTATPWDVMATLIPDGSRALMILSMGVVALIGTSLPVPIAFDVVVTAILLAAGMPVRYAMILLFTLGLYSMYSFFIVWTGISRRIAVVAFLSVAGLGVVAGWVGNKAHLWDLERQRQMFFAAFGKDASPRGPKIDRVSKGEPKLHDPSAFQRLAEEPVPERGADGVSVARIGFQGRVGKAGQAFTRLEGAQLGLDEPFTYSVVNFLTLSRFRAIAAGDVHNDGWVDILISSDQGVSLYANEGGKGYALQKIEDMPELAGFRVMNASLVDLNGDGWLDILFGAYRGGNHVIYNKEGRFSGAAHEEVPTLEGAVMPGAMSMGDIDKDGDLDIVFGNWSLGAVGQTRGDEGELASTRNALVLNEDGKFRAIPAPGVLGETLSALLTDFDNDGNLDLIISNDFRPSDTYCLGDGKGGFRELTREDGIIPITGSSTMSITTADIDNNLRSDIFIAQISGRSSSAGMEMTRVSEDVAGGVLDSDYRKHLERQLVVQAHLLDARNTRDISKCVSIDPEYREDCIALLLLRSAVNWNRSREMCDLFPASWDMFAFASKHSFTERVKATDEEIHKSILQQRVTDNVLLMQDGDGNFVDRSREKGVYLGGWSWNAKFADIDNDEWQDLYIVNGEISSTTRESNFFYKNDKGKKFVDKTEEYGLKNVLATNSYCYVDMDNDGDLDLITVPSIGPIIAYRNNLQGGNSIAFELRDHAGNHFGVGSKITIHYGADGGRHQMREIQAGGGFVSFDAPIAWFGLGDAASVSRVEISWSTGGKTELQGPFAAGARYILTRQG